MFPVLQQVCTKTGPEYLADIQFLQAFTCTYTADIGFFTTGLLLWATVGLSYYAKQGSVMVPLVLLFIFGGVVLSQVASVATPVVVLLLLVVPAGAFAYLYYRYSI